MSKKRAYIVLVLFLFMLFPESCKAREAHIPGTPYYYAEFVGYSMPPHMSTPLTKEEALKSNGYYVAYFGLDNKLIYLEKHFYGSLLHSAHYYYWPSGKLERRESTDDKGEKKVYYYTEDGKLILTK